MTADTILHYIAIVGAPMVLFGFWRLVVAVVHSVDAVQDIGSMLRRETQGNGATRTATMAAPTLKAGVDPSFKDMIGAVLTTNVQLLDAQHRLEVQNAEGYKQFIQLQAEQAAMLSETLLSTAATLADRTHADHEEVLAALQASTEAIARLADAQILDAGGGPNT